MSRLDLCGSPAVATGWEPVSQEERKGTAMNCDVSSPDQSMPKSRFVVTLFPLGMLCCALVTQSCPTLCDPTGCSLLGSSVHGDSSGQNTGVGCHALLQGTFPTQGSKAGLPHCRQVLYHLNYQGSPRILQWVADPFFRRSSWPRNRTRVFYIAGGFFTSWATRETLPLSISSVAQSCLTLRPHGLQQASLPCPSPTPEVCTNSCPLSQWCHPTISSSVIPCSSCLQSFPASGLFQWVSSLHQVAKVLELQLQHQSLQWIFRTDFL